MASSGPVRIWEFASVKVRGMPVGRTGSARGAHQWLEHGVVAVDAPGKAQVRFNGLDTSNSEVIVKAAAVHDACASGAPGDRPATCWAPAG